MTREEEIIEASQNCIYTVPATPRSGFRDGARWADANQPNPWISVEERLPETNEFGGSEDVLILNEYGGMTVAMYGIPENKWYLSIGEIQGDCECKFEITHWMPIHKLPKEEGK